MADGIELTPSAGGGSSTPSGSAGGDLTGTYPNPTIKTSVALGGSPTTTTQTGGDSSTKLATTAFASAAASFTSGTEASLPAAAASNTYASYYATDTMVTFRSTGSTWVPIAWPNMNASGVLGALSNIPVSMLFGSVAVGASGTDQLVGIFIPKNFVVSNIRFRTSGAATLGSNNDSHWYLLIRNQAGALQASTADQGTGAIAATTVITKAIARDSANSAAATWTCPTSAYYLVGINLYFGTGGSPALPTIMATTALGSSGHNSIGSIVSATGQTSMTSGTPATSATPANAVPQPAFWVL